MPSETVQDGLPTLALLLGGVTLLRVKGFADSDSHGAGPADVVFQFGAGGQGYVPLAGNWDGQAGDSIGVYRRSDGAVFLRNTNTAGAADIAYLYGPPATNWVPLTGDWNGPSLQALAAPGEHRRPPNAAVLETLFAEDEDWVE